MRQKNEMKIKLLFLFLTMMTLCCGVFLGENRRSLVYKMESGETVGFSIFENRFPFTEKRYLIVKSGSNYPLRGRNCEDLELKEFSNKVWSEVAKNDNLTGIKSATIMLEKESVQGTPKYCQFGYSKAENGEWIQE